MARRNLRKWAEAKERRSAQYAPLRGHWSYGPYGTGAPIFIEDAPFGVAIAPTVWLPMVEQPLFPDAVGELLHAALDPEPTPGPPYTHTIPAPPGWEYDDEGDPIRPLFWPSMTIEARTPAAYVPIGHAQPDGTDLHPLLLDYGINRSLR